MAQAQRLTTKASAICSSSFGGIPGALAPPLLAAPVGLDLASIKHLQEKSCDVTQGFAASSCEPSADDEYFCGPNRYGPSRAMSMVATEAASTNARSGTR